MTDNLPDTSASNYHYSLSNNPEEHSSFILSSTPVSVLQIMQFQQNLKILSYSQKLWIREVKH
jgi:lipocalin